MNLLWRDDFGSFFDASARDAGGGSALGPDTSLLWTDNGSSPSAAWDTSQDTLWARPGYGTAIWPLADSASRSGQDVLWADPASTTPNWLLTNSGATQFNVSTDTGTPSQWLQFFGLTTPSQTWLTEASNMLWTDTTTAHPSVTPPFATAPQLAGGFLAPSFAALPTDHLVWTDPAQSFPGVISNPTAISAAPTTLAGVGLFSQGTGLLPLLSGAGSH